MRRMNAAGCRHYAGSARAAGSAAGGGGTGNDLAAVDVLADLRIGINMVDLQHDRDALPLAVRAAVDDVLAGAARHFAAQAEAGHAQRAAPELLTDIDRALDGAIEVQGARGRELLLQLVGIRRGLFVDADPLPAPAAARRCIVRPTRRQGSGMIGEVDIYGVFIPILLVWAVIALVLTAVLRRILDPYRLLSAGLAPASGGLVAARPHHGGGRRHSAMVDSIMRPLFRRVALNFGRPALTLVIVAAALVAGRGLWVYYQDEPWTRDGR